MLRASGVDPTEAIQYGEASRYRTFGALVLFTTAMSAAAVLWAVHIATNAPTEVAVGVALLWGFGIFHIDRWLVSTPISRPGPGHRLLLLLPRMAIAVPLGLLVAWFAMLGVAGKEIDQQLDLDRVAATSELSAQVRNQSDLARQREELVAERDGLVSRYEAAVARIDPLQKSFDEECSGMGGSLSKGCGPVAARKGAELDAARNARDLALAAVNQRVPDIDAQIARIDEQLANRVANVTESSERNDGIFARRAALSKVLDRDGEARQLYHLLEIVLIMVDLIPAIAKVVSPVSMLDVAKGIRRQRMREELQSTAAAERASPDIADALIYAATQRAETLREQADLQRALTRSGG
ncbi:hypothetical protein Val02_14260 [Virgisporangium aliadipatigenens]|uniref:DUF4407 domain-containing protein n=2 Tax=Virgisporangium aliadipatigenens TaxID=741659 RepID=A0A8J3YIB3_9ACTN|nr:hypothetical protein Val02_14260 [Virgisporangium aliadipatigenens]